MSPLRIAKQPLERAIDLPLQTVMSEWQERFNEVIYTYLNKSCGFGSSVPADMYNRIQNLEFEYRRGIWEYVSEQLGVPAKQIHNYYHNTWVRQFYDNVSLARPTITRIVTEQLRAGRQINSREIAQLVEREYPDKHFCIR